MSDAAVIHREQSVPMKGSGRERKKAQAAKAGDERGKRDSTREGERSSETPHSTTEMGGGSVRLCPERCGCSPPQIRDGP